MDALNALQCLGARLTEARQRSGELGGEPIAAYQSAITEVEAIRLIELGARVSLVCLLTEMDKTAANRLYRQIKGHPSPPGQTPFTDAWYVQNEMRMLQANIFWRLHRTVCRFDRRPARRLVDTYESYRNLVRQPLLNITRAAFVPRLVTIGLWWRHRCDWCRQLYIGPVTDINVICPGCRLYRL